MRKGRNKLMENVRSKYIKTKYIINRIRYWKLIDFNLVLNTLYRLRNINEIEKWNPSDWKISLMSTIPQKKYSFYDIFTDSSSSLVHTFTTNSLHDLVFSQKNNNNNFPQSGPALQGYTVNVPVPKAVSS